MTACLIGQPDPDFKPRHQPVRTARGHPSGPRIEPTRAGRHQTGTAARSLTGHALVGRHKPILPSLMGASPARYALRPLSSPDIQRAALCMNVLPPIAPGQLAALRVGLVE